VILGLIVGLILSQRSAPKADVPNVIGDSVDIAQLKLDQKGFDFDTETAHRLGPKGTVLEQDPPAGKADQDCDFLKLSCTKPTVVLTVNAGPGLAKVPQVAGLEQGAAEARLRDAHFDVTTQKVASATVPVGTVISSDPAGGSKAREGSEVTLTVSRGPKQVEVPLVVGENQAIAEAEIRSAGLVPDVVKRKDSAEKGQVVQQAPDAGQKVEDGSTVTIVVSSGASTITVPNEIGKTRSSAVSDLRSQGFDVAVSTQNTDVEAQDGKVIDQFPAPGGSAKKGSTVTLTVGHFVAPAPPPATTTTPTVPTPRRG
jgi:beta-lactam-binding protein with PASTA domain